MWSFGCIAAELFLGLPVFPGTDDFNQLCRIIEFHGLPPHYMLMQGKFVSKYFKVTGEKGSHANTQNTRFVLKTPEEYSQESNIPIVPSKRYFNSQSLHQLVMTFPFSSSLNPQEREAEFYLRQSFYHFLTNALNIDPSARFTPQQALQHPFITGRHKLEPGPETRHSLLQPSHFNPITQAQLQQYAARSVPKIAVSDPNQPSGYVKNSILSPVGVTTRRNLSLDETCFVNPPDYALFSPPKQRRPTATVSPAVRMQDSAIIWRAMEQTSHEATSIENSQHPQFNLPRSTLPITPPETRTENVPVSSSVPTPTASNWSFVLSPTAKPFNPTRTAPLTSEYAYPDYNVSCGLPANVEGPQFVSSFAPNTTSLGMLQRAPIELHQTVSSPYQISHAAMNPIYNPRKSFSQPVTQPQVHPNWYQPPEQHPNHYANHPIGRVSHFGGQLQGLDAGKSKLSHRSSVVSNSSFGAPYALQSPHYYAPAPLAGNVLSPQFSPHIGFQQNYPTQHHVSYSSKRNSKVIPEPQLFDAVPILNQNNGSAQHPYVSIQSPPVIASSSNVELPKHNSMASSAFYSPHSFMNDFHFS